MSRTCHAVGDRVVALGVLDMESLCRKELSTEMQGIFEVPKIIDN